MWFKNTWRDKVAENTQWIKNSTKNSCNNTVTKCPHPTGASNAKLPGAPHWESCQWWWIDAVTSWNDMYIQTKEISTCPDLQAQHEEPHEIYICVCVASPATLSYCVPTLQWQVKEKQNRIVVKGWGLTGHIPPSLICKYLCWRSMMVPTHTLCCSFVHLELHCHGGVWLLVLP